MPNCQEWREEATYQSAALVNEADERSDAGNFTKLEKEYKYYLTVK